MNIKCLKKGDIIFVVDETEKNISELSVGFDGYSYYHCALYIGSGQIIEAVNIDGVVQSSLSKYKASKILIQRVKEADSFLDKVISKAKDFLGYSYNDLFLPNTKGRLYCSELIHEVFNIGNEVYFEQHELNYISSKNVFVSQYWADFYGQYGLKVPQGQPGSHPNNLSLDKKFRQKFFIN